MIWRRYKRDRVFHVYNDVSGVVIRSKCGCTHKRDDQHVETDVPLDMEQCKRCLQVKRFRPNVKRPFVGRRKTTGERVIFRAVPSTVHTVHGKEYDEIIGPFPSAETAAYALRRPCTVYQAVQAVRKRRW